MEFEQLHPSSHQYSSLLIAGSQEEGIGFILGACVVCNRNIYVQSL